jgi:hypothetical protein
MDILHNRVEVLVLTIMQDGKGLGFGNLISAQTVAIVKAAKEARRVYRVDDNSPVDHLLIPRFSSEEERLLTIMVRLGLYATFGIILTFTFDCLPPSSPGVVSLGTDDRAITYLRRAVWHGTTSTAIWLQH